MNWDANESEIVSTLDEKPQPRMKDTLINMSKEWW